MAGHTMQSEEDRVQSWRSAIQHGNDELERGEGVAYSAATLADITVAAIGSMNSDKPADPDTRP